MEARKLALLLLPLAAFAQDGRPVIGLPYSAEQSIETVQILADGTRVRHTSTARICRESEGRTREERTLLGTETMEGLPVKAKRITTSWPAGSMLGNDRPIQSAEERWSSSELGVTIRPKRSDPRFGETTERAFHVTPVEPDPILFQPPADYYTVPESHPRAAP